MQHFLLAKITVIFITSAVPACQSPPWWGLWAGGIPLEEFGVMRPSPGMPASPPKQLIAHGLGDLWDRL